MHTKLQTVWVVWDGDYDRIIDIFTTEKGAQDYLQEHEGPHDFWEIVSYGVKD